MSTYFIGIAIGVIVNFLLLAYGYGKLVNKVDQNKRDIDINKGSMTMLVNNCDRRRSECQSAVQSKDIRIFDKMDELKEIINTKFTALSVQVAKLEESTKKNHDDHG